MAKFHKPSPAIYRPKPAFMPKTPPVEEVQFKLNFQPCCVCGIDTRGSFYGRHNDTGTCSSTCESKYFKKGEYNEML